MDTVVKNVMRCIFMGLMLLIISAGGHANESQASIIEVFSIRPGTCVVNPQADCDSNVEFYWQLSRKDILCIYQGEEKEHLYCSNESRQGQVALSVKLAVTTWFTAIATKAPEDKITKQLSVLRVGQDVRMLRRHVWSIF
jgi:hypothetical protein